MDWSNLAGTLAEMGFRVLGTVVGGAPGGAYGAAVGSAIAAALGVEATPAAVEKALAENPDLAKAKLQTVERAQEAELGEIQARLFDTQNARAATADLVHAGSILAWGAPIVTIFVLVIFAAVTATVLVRGLPPGDQTVMIGLVELLKQLAVACVFYWVGSSSGSKRQGDALRDALGTAIRR
jgi:hypothetical protein